MDDEIKIKLPYIHQKSLTENSKIDNKNSDNKYTYNSKINKNNFYNRSKSTISKEILNNKIEDFNINSENNLIKKLAIDNSTSFSIIQCLNMTSYNKTDVNCDQVKEYELLIEKLNIFFNDIYSIYINDFSNKEKINFNSKKEIDIEKENSKENHSLNYKSFLIKNNSHDKSNKNHIITNVDLDENIQKFICIFKRNQLFMLENKRLSQERSKMSKLITDLQLENESLKKSLIKIKEKYLYDNI